MSYNYVTLRRFLDLFYNALGNRFIALIGGTTYLSTGNTIDSSGHFVTAAPHSLVSGSRVRIAPDTGSGATMPPLTSSGFLQQNTDYWAVPVSSTEIALYDRTLSTAVPVTGSAPGTFTITEQTLSAQDYIAAIVNHEITTHPDYTVRNTWTPAAASTLANGVTQVPDYSFTLSVGSGHPTLTFRHVLVLFDTGAVSTLGNTSGNQDFLLVGTSDVVITAGASKSLTVSVPLFDS